MTHGFTPCGTTPPVLGYELLHDLEITPNGQMLVVSGTDIMATFDLASITTPPTVEQGHFSTPVVGSAPASMRMVDSLAVTNTRAIMLGGFRGYGDANYAVEPPTPQQDTEEFRIAIRDLQAGITRYWPATNLGLTSPSQPVPTRAHDVAVTPNGSRGVVTTRAAVLVFNLSAQIYAPGGTPRKLLTGVDPLNFNSFAQFSVIGSKLSMSDSVEVTNSHALTIGTTGNWDDDPANPVNPIFGWVTVINIQNNPPVFVNLPLGQDIVPTDVSISGDGLTAFVRGVNRRLDDSASGSPHVGDAVIAVVDVAAGTLVPITYPVNGLAHGQAFGQDHIVAGGSNLAISAGQYTVQPNGVEMGLFQIITRQ